ncbi:hypothetical protein Glove_9g143 [Diversispora epigaea]|uniref:Cytochrome b561 domain-containing protein n=1 Tax=Diversispora epigaea TaxID=1348612 RepID=A0A397JNU0_9GLOM|nr:hypothetical protein Glove_9g143 [Diversispora epigaea]
MASPYTEEDRLINTQNSYDSIPSHTFPPQQEGRIPTPTGTTKFNMTFTFSLFASAGSLLFAGTVWYIMANAEYLFFIWHPVLMATVLLFTTNGILVLQTATKREEKESGLNWHKLMQSVTFLSVIGGFSIVYSFKNSNHKEHFASPHGKSGLITFTLLLIQAIAGSILVNFPGLVGGVVRSKGMYKYHRFSGYLVLFFVYLTALGGTQSEWVKDQFDHIWIWLLATILVLIGIVGRTKGSKLKIW